MPLPTINSVNPTSIPATPAMEFPNAFLRMLHFYAPDVASKWTLQSETRNYNADAHALAVNTVENTHKVNLPDVGAYALEYPVFAVGLAYVLVLLSKVEAEQKAQADLVAANKLATSDPTHADMVAAATTALAAARQALGAAS